MCNMKKNTISDWKNLCWGKLLNNQLISKIINGLAKWSKRKYTENGCNTPTPTQKVAKRTFLRVKTLSYNDLEFRFYFGSISSLFWFYLWKRERNGLWTWCGLGWDGLQGGVRDGREKQKRESRGTLSFCLIS